MMSRCSLPIVVMLLPGCWATMALAAVDAEVEVAQTERSGTITVACPHAGPHHVGIVYRDVIDDPTERYRVLVGGKRLDEFFADLSPGVLHGDDRLYVWFSEKPHDFGKDEAASVELSSETAGPHQVFAVYFVRPQALDKLRRLISRQSLRELELRPFTRIVGAADGPGATFSPLPPSSDYVELLAADATLRGFARSKVKYTIWGQYVSVVGKASQVNLLGNVQPRPEGYTKPIVTFRMIDEDQALFAGEAFHVATRGTTRYLNTQLSPQFPGVPMTADGAHREVTERALQQKAQGQRVQFGLPVRWDQDPLVWVVGRIGLDMYPEDAENILKERPDIDRHRVLTAYLIRASDGTPKKEAWPLFYWNSWFHGSEGEIFNEEITRWFADVDMEFDGKPRSNSLWFYYDWQPNDAKYRSMLGPRDLLLMTKGGIPQRWIQYALYRREGGHIGLQPLRVWQPDGPLSIKDFIVKEKGAAFYEALLKEAGP